MAWKYPSADHVSKVMGNAVQEWFRVMFWNAFLVHSLRWRFFVRICMLESAYRRLFGRQHCTVSIDFQWRYLLAEYDASKSYELVGEAAYRPNAPAVMRAATATTTRAATVADILCSAFSNSRVIASNLTGGFALSKGIYCSPLATASPVCKYRIFSFPSQSQSMSLMSEGSSSKESVTTARHKKGRAPPSALGLQ